MYHSHTDVATQVSLGLYGPLVVEPKETTRPAYDREATYMLGEWDMEMTPDVATGKAPLGRALCAPCVCSEGRFQMTLAGALQVALQVPTCKGPGGHFRPGIVADDCCSPPTGGNTICNTCRRQQPCWRVGTRSCRLCCRENPGSQAGPDYVWGPACKRGILWRLQSARITA